MVYVLSETAITLFLISVAFWFGMELLFGMF